MKMKILCFFVRLNNEMSMEKDDERKDFFHNFFVPFCVFGILRFFLRQREENLEEIIKIFSK